MNKGFITFFNIVIKTEPYIVNRCRKCFTIKYLKKIVTQICDIFTSKSKTHF